MPQTVPINVYERDSGLVIEINNPPVNALSHSVRVALIDTVSSAKLRTDLRFILLHGHGKLFSAGADIKEFNRQVDEPSLPDVINTIEECEIPVIAAIAGPVLGGGFELALGCRYLVASSNAIFGLPEVSLGLIPGAGGTIRLPRKTGAKNAADIIARNKRVDAKCALEIGIVDAVVSGDLLEEAIEFAQTLDPSSLKPSLVCTSYPDVWDPEWYENFLEQTHKKARGQKAPVTALNSMKLGYQLPFKEALAQEREAFLESRKTEERAALMHIFQAERAAAKHAFLDDETPQRVERIGIVGAGTMGAGIAIACLSSGYQVILVDTNPDSLQVGKERIITTLEEAARKGRLTSDGISKATENLSVAQSLDALGHAELVIEAIVENMDVKKSVFEQLDRICAPNAILASNTSYLDINEIAKATSRPQSVIGMHFFSPANIMKLLEVVETEYSSANAMATAFVVGKKLKKVSVLSGVCDGFIGNRILKKYRQHAEFLIEDGAMPWQVDEAMRKFGYAMGPFEVSDLAGIDIGWHNRRREDANRDSNERYVDIADQLYEQGRLGRKTGAGWYEYEHGNRSPTPSKLVEALIHEASRKKGIVRRDFSETEIQQTLLMAMHREGLDILSDGIAKRSSDIDLVTVYGYGFPKHRGGLMFYGDPAFND